MVANVNGFTEDELKYLKLLSNKYPNINSASAEIINLQAILNLPKGTEHFLSDIHGEYDSFSHVLKNASGVIKNQISAIFGSELRESEKKSLATLIYYPEQKLEQIAKEEKDLEDWYKITLYRLVTICKVLGSKYSRSKVRKSLPKDYSYIIEELIHEHKSDTNKQMYFDQIIETIIRLYQANRFIIALSHLIQRLSVDQLHILGDIYDRGPKASKVMDMIEKYHSVDVQWGNHDIAWMGAAAGCQALICNVLRIQARYANLETIEEDYGINLIPLATFAMETYANDPCRNFMPKLSPDDIMTDKDARLIGKMHKAIAVMQFKEEAKIIMRNPDFNMDQRLLLGNLNLEKGTVTIEGIDYALNDTFFPTVKKDSPYELTPEEQLVMDKIKSSFINSDKLQEHIRVLYTKGSLYKKFNSNLMFHGCIPMNEDGSLKVVPFRGENLKGEAYFAAVDRAIREGYFNKAHSESKRECMDITWYMWCGENSPVFGKQKMTTFERYFVDNKDAHFEISSPFYTLRNKEETCNTILVDFDMCPEKSHIINGHVPVKVVKGESPIKADGKLFVIDGGFSKAYQKVTGIAGYTLIYNSHGLVLVSHEAFESQEKAIDEEKDILSSTVALQYSQERLRVDNTDVGAELKSNISDLEKLLEAYHKGIIKETQVN